MKHWKKKHFLYLFLFRESEYFSSYLKVTSLYDGNDTNACSSAVLNFQNQCMLISITTTQILN